MRLFPRRKTDAEYIEAVRRSVKQSRWFAIYFACMAILYYVLFIMFWRFIPSFADLMPDINETARGAFTTGIILGTMAGLMLFAAFSCVVAAVRTGSGQRTERLMLKFYDEKGMEIAASPFDNPPAADKAQGSSR